MNIEQTKEAIRAIPNDRAMYAGDPKEFNPWPTDFSAADLHTLVTSHDEQAAEIVESRALIKDLVVEVSEKRVVMTEMAKRTNEIFTLGAK